jgi:lysophospholipase L1-like esterase
MPQLILLGMPKDYYQKIIAKFPVFSIFIKDGEISNLRNLLYKRYNDIIKNAARNNNCYLIDAVSYFPRDDSNIDLYCDDVHLNDKGNDFLAEIIYKNISTIIDNPRN